MNTRLIQALILSILLYCNTLLAQSLQLVTSIRPVDGLVRAVTAGVHTPQLLLNGTQSPHHAQLKPSQTRMLRSADVIFMIDPSFEHFLTHSLRQLSSKTTVVMLSTTPQLKQLSQIHHGQQQLDGHLWLDPQNAARMVDTITQVLSQKNPQAAQQYRDNAAQFKADIRAMDTTIKTTLAPVKNRPFMVFHDGYRYFSQAYQLNDQGALLLEPNDPLKAQKLYALQQAVQQGQLDCVFQDEPAQPRLNRFLAENLQVSSQTLDPLGLQQPLGPKLYPNLMLQLATQFKRCLQKKTSS